MQQHSLDPGNRPAKSLREQPLESRRQQQQQQASSATLDAATRQPAAEHESRLRTQGAQKPPLWLSSCSLARSQPWREQSGWQAVL